jgi:hypothetical protein
MRAYAAAMRIVAVALAAGCALVLTGCDPSADFVFGRYENGGHEFVLDAWSGPSGENPQGTLKAEGQLFGTVGCLQVIPGGQARVGLDLSPSIGLTALALVTGNKSAPDGIDVIRLSPSGLPASAVCDADLEAGPPQPGNFVIRDVAPR